MNFLKTLVLFFAVSGLFAQHTISGTFKPAKDFKWLIAYELTPGGQRYVADTAVKDGSFELALPSHAPKGMYRLVYAVPQEEYFIDVLYNKQEDIVFTFSLADGISFVQSTENKLLNDYYSKIGVLNNSLIAWYSDADRSKKTFLQITNALRETQATMEASEPQSMAHELICANRPFIPDNAETLSAFLAQKKPHYFEAMDFNNGLLQSSGFLRDKINNYVLHAVTPNLKDTSILEKEINENVAFIAEKIKGTPELFQLDIYNSLWESASKNHLNQTADYVFANFLKPLALANGQLEHIKQLEASTRLRKGAKSPDVRWTENGQSISLYTMAPADNYLLIFWSSTCSHCLKEIPPLYDELQNYPNVKVIAIGLEDDAEHWEKETAELPNFNHAIALGKWESEPAQTFAIQKTPTYFILDSDKRFIAYPETDKEVIQFLRSKQ